MAEKIQYNKTVWRNNITPLNETNMNHIEDGLKATADAVDNIKLDKVIETSYDALKTLRDASSLTPGQQYRITDYVTTTVQENTQSAGHAFDLIAVADSVDKLNEQARAIQHAGDTYFANSKLEAWQVWYSLDNDTNRFAWADSANGKGVIYRLIDEFNNDVSYDFKNIQFKRKIAYGEYDPDGIDTWVYTFTWVNEDDEIEDLSLIGNSLLNDAGSITGIFDNKISETSAYSVGIEEEESVLALGDSVFMNSYAYENGIFYGCYGNKFGVNCFGNTFGNNVFGNSFGNSVNNNSFGNDVSYNSFGNNVSNNTFSNGVYSNSFGNDVYNNSFGNDVSGNTFGDYVDRNSFGNNFLYNTVKNNVRFVRTPDAVRPNTFQYVTLESGLAGAGATNRLNLEGIQAVVGYNTPIKVARGVGEEIVAVWQSGTGDIVGLRKATPTTADWIGAYGGLAVETWNTATKTLVLSDSNKLFKCSHAANQTLTIPTNATVAFPIGTMITFLLTSTYTVTFSGASGVILTSIDSLVELATQYGMASLIKTDTNTWQLVGAL